MLRVVGTAGEKGVACSELGRVVVVVFLVWCYDRNVIHGQGIKVELLGMWGEGDGRGGGGCGE